MSKFLTEKSQKVPRTPRGAWRGALAISFVTHKSLNYYSRNYPPIELLTNYSLPTFYSPVRITHESAALEWSGEPGALLLYSRGVIVSANHRPARDALRWRGGDWPRPPQYSPTVETESLRTVWTLEWGPGMSRWLLEGIEFSSPGCYVVFPVRRRCKFQV